MTHFLILFAVEFIKEIREIEVCEAGSITLTQNWTTKKGEKKKYKKKAARAAFRKRCLTMSYSHMGRPHTTIGAIWFHF